MNGDSSRASDTSPVEVTKKGICSDVFKQIRKHQPVHGRNSYYNHYRIPIFSGADDPVTQLIETDVFKTAQNVLVGYDKAQESIRLACLRAKKTLYVQVPKLQNYLMTKLKLDDNATEETLLEAIKLKGLEEYGTTIGMEDKVPIDLIVVGSFAVSKDGVRIGKGDGYVDLYLAVLNHLKLINANTPIITTVNDCQLVETIPSNVIGAHDFPVDMIITPTQVINCSKDKPTAIFWNLVYPHKLKVNQLLNKIREKEIENGNECTLKVVDTEKSQRRFYYRYQYPNNRRWQGPRYRKQVNGVHSESENYEGGNAESGVNNKQEKGYRRPFMYRRRPVNHSTGKSSYRDKAWQNLRANHVSTTPRHPYYRIPGFKGVQEATKLFSESESFKNAKNILVSSDRLHKGIRLTCLEQGINLYVLNPKREKTLLIRVDVPAPVGDEKPDLDNLINIIGLNERGVKITADDAPKMDLWVVGSVAISKDGHHIGKGDGSIDMFYGYLSEKKIVTPETKIVTLVHDCQVFDTLPAELFADHDIPVNTVVTPSQILEIQDSNKTPSGVLWGLLSERRLNSFPYLSDFREKEVLAGKPCTLKEENSEGDGRKKSSKSNDYSESEQNELTEGESGTQHRKRRVGQKTWRKGRRNHKETVDNEESGNISPDTTSRPRRNFGYRHQKFHIDFSIKLTSIHKTARVKDLKAALNERSVKPNAITWKGHKGFCYLHFSKTQPPPSAESETEINSESILTALADLTLQPTSDTNEDCAPQPNKVSVELAKPYTRIETAEETAV